MKKIFERIYTNVGNKILCIINFVLLGIMGILSFIPGVYTIKKAIGEPIPSRSKFLEDLCCAYRTISSSSENIFAGATFQIILGVIFIILLIIVVINYILKLKVTNKLFKFCKFIPFIMLLILIINIVVLMFTGCYDAAGALHNLSYFDETKIKYVTFIEIGIIYYIILILNIGLAFTSLIYIFGENKNTIKKEIKNNASEEDVLKKYKKLLDEGLITEEDYNIKKKEILNIKY